MNIQSDLSIANIGSPATIWSIPAIHGDIEQLTELHDKIAEKFKIGDSIIYHGNYIGYGAHSSQCVDEVLAFRRQILSLLGVKPTDFIYLRGIQEEILRQLLQIAFSPNPTDAFLWMIANGLSPILESYGFCHHDGIEACRVGVTGLTRWTEQIRNKIRSLPGHEVFYASLKRAAHTHFESDYPMLFVHAGLDANKTLYEQGDSFWWEAEKFHSFTRAYEPFGKVVRGYDPAHRGTEMNCIKATVDNGCGFGGRLTAVAFDKNGSIVRSLMA